MSREQPELHIVGEIVGASDYELPSLFCKFNFEVGGNFRLLQGITSGQTHCDMPPEGEAANLTHPIDVHYAVKGIDGWPRIRIEVYGVDQYGRIELAGYGCCFVPTTAGTHELRCATWRPCGTMREQFWSARPRARLECDALVDYSHSHLPPSLSRLTLPSLAPPRPQPFFWVAHHGSSTQR